MPSSHDNLLTPTEHEAAQLLVALAWRLDGGQLASADQLLARLCAIPTNDVAMASIVLLREVAHSVTPALQRRPSEILDHLRSWLAGQAGRPANAAQSRDPSCRAVLPAFCPTDLHRAARTRTTLNSQSSWTPADQGEYDSGEPSRMEPDESHPAENRKPSRGGACIEVASEKSRPSYSRACCQSSLPGAGLPAGAAAIAAYAGPSRLIVDSSWPARTTTMSAGSADGLLSRCTAPLGT
jgi:hypothetical protein